MLWLRHINMMVLGLLFVAYASGFIRTKKEVTRVTERTAELQASELAISSDLMAVERLLRRRPPRLDEVPEGWDVGRTEEITELGSEQGWVAMEHPPPQPACPICRGVLDEGGHCASLDCSMFSILIPLPDWTAHLCQKDESGHCIACGR